MSEQCDGWECQWPPQSSLSLFAPVGSRRSRFVGLLVCRDDGSTGVTVRSRDQTEQEGLSGVGGRVFQQRQQSRVCIVSSSQCWEVRGETGILAVLVPAREMTNGRR